jgi:hypothetical protein
MSALRTPDGKIKKGYVFIGSRKNGDIIVGMDFSHACQDAEPVLTMEGQKYVRGETVPFRHDFGNEFCSLRQYKPV